MTQGMNNIDPGAITWTSDLSISLLKDVAHQISKL